MCQSLLSLAAEGNDRRCTAELFAKLHSLSALSDSVTRNHSIPAATSSLMYGTDRQNYCSFPYTVLLLWDWAKWDYFPLCWWIRGTEWEDHENVFCAEWTGPEMKQKKVRGPSFMETKEMICCFLIQMRRLYWRPIFTIIYGWDHWHYRLNWEGFIKIIVAATCRIKTILLLVLPTLQEIFNKLTAEASHYQWWCSADCCHQLNCLWNSSIGVYQITLSLWVSGTTALQHTHNYHIVIKYWIRRFSLRWCIFISPATVVSLFGSLFRISPCWI